jgi:hypothetical protein
MIHLVALNTTTQHNLFKGVVHRSDYVILSHISYSVLDPLAYFLQICFSKTTTLSYNIFVFPLNSIILALVLKLL